MSNEEWDIIFEQLRAPLKQGFEAVTEAGRPCVSAQIAKVTVTLAPGLSTTSKLFCFIAHEPIAAVIQATSDGVQKMSEIAAEQFQEAMAARPRIIKPSDFGPS
jgi:hypothetical protein